MPQRSGRKGSNVKDSQSHSRHDHTLEAAPGFGLWGRIKRLHIKTVEEGMERSMGNE